MKLIHTEVHTEIHIEIRTEVRFRQGNMKIQQ